MPLVRPVIEIGLEAPATVTAVPPLVGVQVTLKLVAVLPLLAAVKLTLAEALPAVAVPMVGAPGTDAEAVVPLPPPPQAANRPAKVQSKQCRRANRFMSEPVELELKGNFNEVRIVRAVYALFNP